MTVLQKELRVSPDAILEQLLADYGKWEETDAVDDDALLRKTATEVLGLDTGTAMVLVAFEAARELSARYKEERNTALATGGYV